MKIHLGCWHRYIPNWVHVDLCDMEHIDYNRDIRDLSCFEDGVADIIYSSHCFEYFDRYEGNNVLMEWFRVLKKGGGTIRLSVPDFNSLITIYSKTGNLDKIIGPLFGRMNLEGKNGKELIYHKTVWDEKSLTKLLQDVGFEDIRIWDWRETEHANIDDHSQAYYPYMDKENGIQVSLNIEATKK